MPQAAVEATRPVKVAKASKPAKPARASRAGKAGKAEQVEAAEAEAIAERRRYSADAKTFHALMALAAESEANKIGQAITRSIAQAMLADLCFLITIGENESLNLVCGYDLIREESLGGTTLTKDSVPLLANAIKRGRPLRLPASSTSSDLQGLSQVLGLSNVGHLLGVPISTRERGSLGCILILSPYSGRLWSAEDQTYLGNVASLFIPILERAQKTGALQVERDRAVQELERARDQSAEAARRYEQAAKEIESLQDRIAQSHVQAENMASLVVMQEQAQKTIERLRAENEQLRSGGEAPSEEYEQMESELRKTLQEMARMQNSLAKANQKILELEQRPSSPITTEQVEVIASISQELRQPMSSIVGYTDLLLGESVGVLGALQRKFVERIKASTERIGSLVEDLIQITNLEAGKREFKQEAIDLNLIIDNAMAYTSTQIREKNITLRLDIPEQTPALQTDRDAFQQVLIHLLQNATGATQAEGSIVLCVRLQQEGGSDFLSIQVTDGGGGIEADDLPLVFARRYRAEHSLIQGLGDTGVGLSIAKTLVEAQGGRIWVETESGVGSTFSVLLPVQVEAVK
jgi:signal transduction histidine kinase